MLGGAERNRFLSRVTEGAYRVARRNAIQTATPAVRGTIAEYIAARAGTPHEEAARRVLLNKVRVCPTCGKPNGLTLPTCNKCQQDLSAVGPSFTNNLFSAFVLGIEREPKFPLKLSMRLETERLMVFDDPLALSPLHFCAVPSTAFIPDWRYLALRPAEGLALSQELVRACHRAAEDQFLSDPAWCASLLATGCFAADRMIAGYNVPPSQNQLHVQYILPAFMPHQFMMFLRGVHFTPGRFFPVTFVERCLQALIAANAHLDAADMDRPVEELLELLKAKCGVDYKREHAAFLEDVDQLHKQLANWKPENFRGISRAGADVKAGELVFESFAAGDEDNGTSEPESVVYEREKGALQTYGKSPVMGADSMGYYSYAKRLEDLDFSFLGLS